MSPPTQRFPAAMPKARSDTQTVMARSRRLVRIHGMPDTLALRLEIVVPPGRPGRPLAVETHLSRADAERVLTAFDSLVR